MYLKQKKELFVKQLTLGGSRGFIRFHILTILISPIRRQAYALPGVESPFSEGDKKSEMNIGGVFISREATPRRNTS
jgi:hypothetical protein